MPAPWECVAHGILSQPAQGVSKTSDFPGEASEPGSQGCPKCRPQMLTCTSETKALAFLNPTVGPASQCSCCSYKKGLDARAFFNSSYVATNLVSYSAVGFCISVHNSTYKTRTGKPQSRHTKLLLESSMVSEHAQMKEQTQQTSSQAWMQKHLTGQIFRRSPNCRGPQPQIRSSPNR